jgi:hypothetical protein
VFAGLVILFFAGITSSLAGTPWMGFMRDEFGWSKNKGASFLDNDFSFRFTNSYFKEGV